MTERQILIDARARISDYRNWCTGARHKRSRIMKRDQWCSEGSLAVSSTGSDARSAARARKLLVEAAHELGFGGIVMLNDAHPIFRRDNHQNVLKMFDLAISKAPQPKQQVIFRQTEVEDFVLDSILSGFPPPDKRETKELEPA